MIGECRVGIFYGDNALALNLASSLQATNAFGLVQSAQFLDEIAQTVEATLGTLCVGVGGWWVSWLNDTPADMCVCICIAHHSTFHPRAETYDVLLGTLSFLAEPAPVHTSTQSLTLTSNICSPRHPHPPTHAHTVTSETGQGLQQPDLAGDYLANYVDAGGRVVLLSPTFHDNPLGESRILGRFASDGMAPLIGGAVTGSMCASVSSRVVESSIYSCVLSPM